MDQNIFRNTLNLLFQEVSTFGINENNKNDIIYFLADIIDSEPNELFDSNLLYNFLILLKNQQTSNKLILHLIEEVELKGLRLTWMQYIYDNMQSNNTCNCNQIKRNNQPKDKVELPLNNIINFNDSPLSQVVDNIAKEKQGINISSKKIQQRRPNN